MDFELPFKIAGIIIAIAVMAFMVIVSGVCVIWHIRGYITRKEVISDHEMRKLKAFNEVDYNTFYTQLHDPQKALPVYGESCDTSTVDRFIEE